MSPSFVVRTAAPGPLPGGPGRRTARTGTPHPWILVGALFGAALLIGESEARAYCDETACYCRSTTCTGDCPRDLDGCKTTGAPLSWPTSCVGFSVQREGTINLPMKAVRTVIDASFFGWTSVACSSGEASISFAEIGDAGCHRAEYNEDGPNANIILFQDSKWTYKSKDNTLAKTTVSFDNDTGEIFDADIEINQAYNHFTTVDGPPCDATTTEGCVDYDLQSVLTHEVGHFIGLDHTPSSEATMYAEYHRGEMNLRTIEPDDIAAVCAVYPADRGVKCNPTPRNGFSSQCGEAAPTEEESGGCAVSSPHPATTPRGRTAALACMGAAALLARRRRAMRRR
jgi:hypothetical protein